MTKEYIDREALRKRLEDFSEWCKDGRKQGVDFVLDCSLPNIPAADVVEVVRCGDCKHATFYSCRNDACYRAIICEYEINTDDEIFFCSYGERKDNGTAQTQSKL